MNDIQDIDLDELEKYVRDRREQEEKVRREAIRAEQQRILDEVEARREAQSKREAEERARNDPSAKVAELLYKVLSDADQWGSFVTLMGRATFPKVGTHLSRIEGERVAGLKYRGVIEAGPAREAAKVAEQTERRTAIEAQLHAAGLMRDVTPETD